MDLTQLPASQNPVMSGSKILAEILRIVIDMLLAQKLPKWFFWNLRLVSKQFNDVVTPLIYRHIVLSSRDILLLVSNETTLSPHELQIARDIRGYTRHVFLKGDLPVEHLRSVFESLKYLREVTNSWPRTIWPSSLIDLINCRPEIRLSTVNLELNMANAMHLSNLNPRQLVSCKILNYFERSQTRSPLKQFLLGKENLETLHLNCTGIDVAVTENKIQSSERMPAVKELVLRGYHWNHSPVAAVQFWNWSRITHLELWRVPILPFLATVKPEHLIHLRTFKTDGFCPGDAHLRNDVCSLLCELLYGIKALEDLSISLLWRGVDEKWKQHLVRAISRHGTSLRYLEFEAQRYYEQLIIHVPSNPTQMNYVAELRLTNVVELSLDNATIQVEKMLYLGPISGVGDSGDIDYATILAGFRNLRRLTIWTQPRDIMRVHNKESMIQETRAAATAWLHRLLQRKGGARFESICFRLEIFCDLSGDPDTRLQSLVARLCYRYDGYLPFQEHLHTLG